MISSENNKMVGWVVLGMVSMAVFLFFMPLNVWVELFIAVISAALCSYFLLKAKFHFPWNLAIGETYSKVNAVGYIVLAPLFFLIASVVAPYFINL